MTFAVDPAPWAAQSRTRRRIVFVLASLGAGGAERVVSLIAGAWAWRGDQVTLIAFDHVDDPVFHTFDPAIALIRLGIAPGKGKLGGAISVARRWWTLRRTLQSISPGVTIAFLTKINVLTLLASLQSTSRVIISERNNPRLQQASRLWTALLGPLSHRADAIVMQTSASLACLTADARSRAHVIPNPVDMAAIPPRMNGPPVLAAVGRLTHQKGFDLLIGAFAAAIATDHPEWTLVIWGEGPARGDLQRLIDEAGLASRITMPGNSVSPDAWAEMAHAFVLSSRHEGFSNVLAEAMAAGLCVVAFDCDFSPAELIKHDHTGILVANGDITALALALSRIMGDADLRCRLGRAAQVDSARYAPRRIVARWDRVIEQLVTPVASA